MSHYTKRQLAIDTLYKLGYVPADGTPSAMDLDYVMRVYDGKLAEWRDRSVVYWPNSGAETAEIPAAVYQTLVQLLENWIGPTYGKSAPVAEQRAVEEMLLKELKRHVARPPTGLTLPVDTF
jgi:hypothetical protein